MEDLRKKIQMKRKQWAFRILLIRTTIAGICTNGVGFGAEKSIIQICMMCKYIL